jgi:hypothetical protein
MDSVSSVASMATAMQQQKVAQNINTAIFTKVHDAQKQDGQLALALLQSSIVTPQSVDVHV